MRKLQRIKKQQKFSDDNSNKRYLTPLSLRYQNQSIDTNLNNNNHSRISNNNSNNLALNKNEKDNNNDMLYYKNLYQQTKKGRK